MDDFDRYVSVIEEDTMNIQGGILWHMLCYKQF